MLDPHQIKMMQYMLSPAQGRKDQEIGKMRCKTAASREHWLRRGEGGGWCPSLKSEQK